MADYKFVRLFSELGIRDVSLVGGKNASLGEMYRQLHSKGVRVPNGFATIAEAYHLYLEQNSLKDRITSALQSLDINDVQALAETGALIRGWIMDAELPDQVSDEIVSAYQLLGQETGEQEPEVAVRSSATAEDLPDASFAGQQETYLNIKGKDPLLRTCKKVLASLFTDRAITYRVHKGFNHMSVALSIGVQHMVRSDLGASGVMFTLDTESGFRDVVMITAAYGLGENVVQGAVNPDEFLVYKNTLSGRHRPIIRRQLGSKTLKMIYGEESTTTNVEVPMAERNRFAISDDEVLQLARYAMAVEKHYGRPMDIEWAKDGLTGEIYIVQARPETVQANTELSKLETYRLKQRSEVLVTGKSVGARIGTGKVRTILNASQMKELQPDEVLVTDMTDPDWEPILKRASAIVTNRGGRVCHAAIIARELGIPAIVGTGDATEQLADGQEVTVSCAEGEDGNVHAGILDFEVQYFDASTRTRPRTKIMLIVGNPGQAMDFCRLPNDGVGLARMEFIISNSIGIHPHALLDFEKLQPDLQQSISEHIAGYPDPREFYIARLAEGIATIAAAFYPKPVIVRMSDFKSNEYRKLLGGGQYEPREENPMLGWRGASRYHAATFSECFKLECEAVLRVREAMGLDNLEVLLPFVRTVDEQQKVIQLMAANGLVRGDNGLRVYVMCEIPANALLADQFLEHCDGFSIGSNDLTQLTLGVDRDSELLGEFDERDPAVGVLMEMAIQACVKADKYIGICGQAPSDFPEITRWLVRRGIHSIALNPDSVLKMTELVIATEADLDGESNQPD